LWECGGEIGRSGWDTAQRTGRAAGPVRTNLRDGAAQAAGTSCCATACKTGKTKQSAHGAGKTADNESSGFSLILEKLICAMLNCGKALIWQEAPTSSLYLNFDGNGNLRPMPNDFESLQNRGGLLAFVLAAFDRRTPVERL